MGTGGLLLDRITGDIQLAPVYDNGNAFFNKRSSAQMKQRLSDIALMESDAYKTPTCV